MSFLENIKLIASELSSMSPRTQLEIVKLCKDLCIETKNYLVELDETTIPLIDAKIQALETATNNLQTLYTNIADELQTAESNITANANAIELLQGSVEAITEALDGIYTKSQVDTLLSAKADKLDTYTKTEVNNLLSAKADASNVYAKADTYNKTEVNTLLNDKADKATTYTKTEVDNALSGKANVNDVYSKSQVDTALNDKADKATTYTKTEVDTALSGKASLSGNNTFTGENTFDNNATFESDVVFNGETSIDNELHLDNPSKIYFNDDSKTLNTKLSEKQDVLTAGSGISIQNNVISATGGGGSQLYAYRITFEMEFSNFTIYIISTSNINAVSTTTFTYSIYNDLKTLLRFHRFSLTGAHRISTNTYICSYFNIGNATEAEFDDDEDIMTMYFYSFFNGQMNEDSTDIAPSAIRRVVISKEAL